MNALRNRVEIPAMSREEWEQQPEVFKYFHPWERAREPMTIKPVTSKMGKPLRNFARMIRQAKGKR
jgi:hypothetical protein